MVLWHVSMSLDGFIAGPDDAMDWVFEYPPGPNPVVEEVIRTTGAILAGRRWYDVAKERHGGRAGIYGGAWTGPVSVLTLRPPDASGDPEITFLSDGVDNAFATARSAAGGKNVGIFGASVAHQSIDHGLLDEIVVHLVPVLLGDGVRFFSSPGTERTRLETLSVGQSGQMTDLRFRVKNTPQVPGS
jgi:dihydrofolate reductase